MFTVVIKEWRYISDEIVVTTEYLTSYTSRINRSRHNLLRLYICSLGTINFGVKKYKNRPVNILIVSLNDNVR
jgi:hypothetical protein